MAEAGVLSGLVGAAGIVAGHMASNKSKKSNAKAREREYVRTFGTTSDGSRPSKNKTGLK